MPREEFQKHTFNLRPGDYAYLQEVFGPSGLSAAAVIRRIVANHVDHLRKQEEPISLTFTLDLKGNSDE